MKKWHILHINWYKVPSINGVISFLNLDHHLFFGKRPRISNQSDFFRWVKFLIRVKMVRYSLICNCLVVGKYDKIFHKWSLNMWFTMVESVKNPKKKKKHNNLSAIDICRSLFFPSCFFVVPLPSTRTVWNTLKYHKDHKSLGDFGGFKRLWKLSFLIWCQKVMIFHQPSQGLK